MNRFSSGPTPCSWLAICCISLAAFPILLPAALNKPQRQTVGTRPEAADWVSQSGDAGYTVHLQGWAWGPWGATGDVSTVSPALGSPWTQSSGSAAANRYNKLPRAKLRWAEED